MAAHHAATTGRARGIDTVLSGTAKAMRGLRSVSISCGRAVRLGPNRTVVSPFHSA